MKWDELKNRINQKQQKLTINLKDSEFGEELIYNIKNSTSLLRAQTLFTKEPVIISWIRKFIKDRIFFDIGANVGIYSIYAEKISKVKVYSSNQSQITSIL